MKLVGRTKTGWIITATDDEVAAIAGYSSSYARQQKRNKNPEEGEVIEIGVLYKNASETMAAYAEIRDEFKKATVGLGRLLALMGPEDAKK